MPAYKGMSFEELRVQDYEQGRKAGNATAAGSSSGFGFGQAQGSGTQSGGLFGGAQQTQTGGAFGQTQPQQQGGGLFGQSTAQTGQTGGLFGQQQQQPATGGLFGGQQQQPAQTGGLFGGQQASQPASTGFSFGNNSTQQQQQQQPQASTGFSFGAANNNAPKPGGLFGSTGTTFGSTPAAGASGSTGFSFGGQQNQQQQQQQQSAQSTGAFGQGASTGFSFGAPKPATGGLFGNNATQPAATTSQPAFGGFGAANTGAAASKPGFSFGGTAAPQASGSTFGSTPAPATGGLFGQSQTTSQPAASNAFGSGFGAGQNNTNQQQQPAQSGFGTGTTGGLFGQSKPGGLFGGSTTQPAGQATGGFGSTGTTTGFNFGGANAQQGQQQKPGFSFPGSSTTGGGGLFGNNATGATGSLFGNNNAGASGTTGGLFGSNNNQQQGGSGSLFGQSNLGQSQLGGSMGPFGGSVNQQSQQLPPQGIGLTSDPYGTDALFRSMTGGSAVTQPNLPFNVSTSGGLPLSASQRGKPLPAPMMSPFRPNPKNASRVVRLRGGTPAREFSPSASGLTGHAGRSSSPAPAGASGLFKGLSDQVGSPSDSNGLPSQAFVGRQSVKRLVLTDNGNSSFGRSIRGGTADPDRSANLSGLGGLRSGTTSIGAGKGVAFSPAAEIGLGSARRDLGNLGGDDSFGDASFSRSRSALFNDTPSKANNVQSLGKDLLGHQQTAAAEKEPSLAEIAEGDYHLSPSLQALRQKSYSALKQVGNFTVTRKGFGSVRFLEPVDLTGIQDLSIIPGGIVQLREKEIWVYPTKDDLHAGLDGMRADYERNPAPKVKQGEALNVPAEVTLEKCWPLDKATRQPLKDSNHARVKQHTAKLQKKAETHFIDYNAAAGTWKFEVDHFSRYGLDDSDEDSEDNAAPPSKTQSKSGKSFDAPPPRRTLRASSRRPGSPEGAPSLTSASSDEGEYDEDDDELDSQTSSDMHESELGGVGSKGEPHRLSLKESTPRATGRSARTLRERTHDSTGPSSQNKPWAAQLGLEARRVQVMQASFFGSRAPGESEEIKARTPGGDVDDGMVVTKRKFVAAGDAKQKNTTGEDAVQARSNFTQTAFSYDAPLPQLADIAPVVSKFAKVGIQDSITNGRDGIPLDAGLAFGRSFRVGFGPQGTFVHNGSLQGVAGEQKPRPTPLLHSPFSVLSIQEARVHKADRTDEEASKALKLLELQLEKSSISSADEDESDLPEGCPAAFPQSSLRFKDFAAAFDNTDKSQEASLWRLGVALFDEIDLRLPEGASQEVVEKVTSLRRKAALSSWLRHAVAESVETECRGHIAASRHAAQTFALLTGNQIEKACCASLDTGDLRLATLLAQLGGGDDETRAELGDQLAIWRNEGVDAHISKDHRKIYEVLSGNVTFSKGNAAKSVRDPIDRVEDLHLSSGLDWKRSFGLHLWYGTSHSAPLSTGFESFEDASHQPGQATPPLPPHLEKAGLGSLKLQEMVKKGDYHRDALFNLIKVYANRSFDLETALSPLGFGTAVADYRLPWHLYVVLSRVLRRRDFADRLELGVDVQDTADLVGVSIEGNSARADRLTSDYANQLELQGQWLWSAFILLHLELPGSRIMAIKALLARTVVKLEDEEAVEFLTSKLKIPQTWIYEAQAIQAKYKNNRFSEYELLIKARLYTLAHEVAVRHLAPEVVIRGDLDMLFNLFSPFQDQYPEEGLQDQLPGWSTGGQIYVDYAACLDQLPNLLGGHDLKTLTSLDEARLTRLGSRVFELLSAVPDLFGKIEAGNMNHIVARSEMMQGLHNLARALSNRGLESQNGMTVGGGVATGRGEDDGGLAPGIEQCQNAANDYMALLLAA